MRLLASRCLLFLIALALAGCGGKAASGFNADELVRLKMAVQGKRPDGSALKPGDADYISPDDAEKQLQRFLQKHLSLAPAGAAAAEPAAAAPPPAELPLILGTQKALLEGGLKAAGGWRPCRLLVEASGVPLDLWGNCIGTVVAGRASLPIPSGVVRVRVSSGVFRPVIERAARLGAGDRLRIERSVPAAVPALTQLPVRPCRLAFVAGGLDATSASTWAERVRLLEAAEGAAVLAVAGPAEAVPAGGRHAAFVPAWPGYGKYLVLSEVPVMEPSEPALPFGRWLAQAQPALVGCALPGRRMEASHAALEAPEAVFKRWPALEEVFGNTGLFDHSQPSELALLALSGRVRHVLLEAAELPDRYVRLLRLHRGLLPLLMPAAFEAWPDLLVPADTDALAAVKSGCYSIGSGLYVWAKLDGSLPGQQVPAGSRLLEVYAFTGALRGAGIERVDVYYNGRLVSSAAGQADQVFMSVRTRLNLEEAGWLLVCALGSAREDAHRREGNSRLVAVCAPFHIGSLPVPLYTRLALSAVRPDGAPAADVEVRAGIDGETSRLAPKTPRAPSGGRTDSAGRVQLEVQWGEPVRILSATGGEQTVPWLDDELKRLLRIGQCGQPGACDEDYWRQAEMLLRRRQASATVP